MGNKLSMGDFNLQIDCVNQIILTMWGKNSWNVCKLYMELIGKQAILEIFLWRQKHLINNLVRNSPKERINII